MLALNTRLQFFSFWHVLEEAQPSREPLAGTSRNADVMRVNSTKTFRSLGNGRLAIILGFCLSALAACQRAETDAPAPAAAADLGTISVGEEVASFYRERGFKPLWFKGRELKPDANLLFRKIGEAALHGVDPAQYEPERLRQGVEAAKFDERLSATRRSMSMRNSSRRRLPHANCSTGSRPTNLQQSASR
jgi:murein L,D-transpeptidase YcbB/YkuD